jgi:dipeptidyl aminopeptidase/acylaminoacyl peptidase
MAIVGQVRVSQVDPLGMSDRSGYGAGMPQIAPYGSWASQITLDRLVEKVVTLGMPISAGDDIYWTELRPADGGRQVVVRRHGTGQAASEDDVFDSGFHARTLVHEYGGIPYTVSGETVYFSNLEDQRLYRVTPGTGPEPITPEPPVARSVRYAAPVVTPDGRHLFAVRERHPDPDVPAEVVNDIVVLATDGGEPRAVAGGHDFFSHVTLSPDGRKLAWTSWDHPNMPWDGTELWEAELSADLSVAGRRLVAGGIHESVTQPKYSPEGVLHFISDRTGWWNLYADDGGQAGGRALVPMEADLGVPDWIFGVSTYVFLSNGTIMATWGDRGIDRIGVLRPGESAFAELSTVYTSFAALRATADGRAVVATAGSPSESWGIVRITPPASGGAAGVVIEVLKRSRGSAVDAAYVSIPESIEFPTAGGLSAHALYYPPHNPDFVAPVGELPPLIVSSHGGPTAAATSVLNYAVQFWTSRGIGVVDVNYGGSTGYGRAYRERLKGNWGIVDLDDCVNAARHLGSSDRADPSRLLIHGGSAGGYTTLCAVTFRDVFAAGASYFGVADAGALARETHKFESRYLDSMIGPWPEAEATYRERSPIFHTDMLRTPLILFQGLEDKIVPPAQAEAMAAALREKGVPYAYVTYEGEQHGFRKAENVKRTSEAELYFYGRVLGFAPADDLDPVTIENEDRLALTHRP